MADLQEQTLILNDIVKIVHEEAGGDYDTATCDFKAFGDGDEATMITSLQINKLGTTIDAAISNTNIFTIVDLAVTLRCHMASHTGGLWNAFRMRLDEQRRANVKFNYDTI